jgi:ERCC4-related helicase
MKIAFPKQILEKHLNIKFYENLSSEDRVVQRGRTVRQARRS